jgi:hypothetical protein
MKSLIFYYKLDHKQEFISYKIYSLDFLRDNLPKSYPIQLQLQVYV